MQRVNWVPLSEFLSSSALNPTCALYLRARSHIIALFASDVTYNSDFIHGKRKLSWRFRFVQTRLYLTSAIGRTSRLILSSARRLEIDKS
jgi:hypothetical protein